MTLILSAERSAIANDLARDSGLLLKVLGDQIPGLNKMAVFVQTEAQMSQTPQGQSIADFYPNNRGQRPQQDKHEELEWNSPHVPNDASALGKNATGLRIRI